MPDQRCATSFDDDDNDCGFFLWEDDIADAEEDMQQRAGLSSRKRTGLSSRKRTADVAGMDTEGNAGGGPSDRGRQQQHRRVGTASPTPGPSRLQIPGLERRRDDAEPQGGGGGGGDSTFDSIMGILGEWQIEVPREARLRIQAELLDQKHALEDGVLRIRQLEEKLACLHK